MRLEWDPAKDEINRAKHGLSFEEVSSLFKSGVDYLDDVLRILSARVATKSERRRFEAYRKGEHEGRHS